MHEHAQTLDAVGFRRRLTYTAATAFCALLIVSLGGCQGVLSAPLPSQLAVASEGAFTCDPQVRAPSAPLVRLTSRQYRNTLDDLVRWALRDEAMTKAVLAAAQGDLALVPAEQRRKSAIDPRGTHRRLDQDVSQTFVDATMNVAVTLATELVAPARIGKLVGPCATDADGANDEACLRTFIREFGSRALRAPLAEADVEYYRALYGADPTPSTSRMLLVVAAFLSAPRLLYLVENGEGPESPSATRALAQHELAARLSYRLWDTLPDDELLAAAAAHELTGPGLEAQVERMLADPRAHASVRLFFEEWLRLDELPDIAGLRNDAVYAAFAGADLPGQNFRQAMVDDALALVDHALSSDQGGRLSDLLVSPDLFPADATLARIYGVPVWTPGSSPAVAPERPGILTRVALLFRASRTGQTNPIMKGVSIRQDLLCDEIPPPPPDAMAQALATPLPPNPSRRQAAELLTEAQGSSCTSCHSTVINPLGYVFEGFDTLGRMRTHELVFDDVTGQLLAEHSVDTRSVPRVTADDDTEVSSPSELAERIVASGKFEECAARHYFRYVFSRLEEEAVDGCSLERLRVAAADDTLRGFAESAVLDPTFLERTFDEE